MPGKVGSGRWPAGSGKNPKKNTKTVQAMANKKLIDMGVPAGKVDPTTGEDFGGWLGTHGLPAPMVDGKPNVAYYRAQLDILSEKIIEGLQPGAKLPANAQQLHRQIMDAAQLAGINPRSLADRRTDEDKLLDFAEQLMSAPEAILDQQDETLDAIQTGMDRANELCRKYIDDTREDIRSKAEPWKIRQLAEKLEKQGKAWRSRIERVKLLREMARSPRPKISCYRDEDRAWWEAAHLLRFMLYVGRSNMASLKTPAARVFDIGEHHAKFSSDLWEAKEGIWYAPDGSLQWGKIPYRGFCGVMPPGHGKTEMANHAVALFINFEHREQILLLHANAEMAGDNKKYISYLFQPDNDAGLRNLSMFPARVDVDNATELRLKLETELKSPTLEAHGVDDKALGANSSIQVKDDVVPQTDRDRGPERERRARTLSTTWGSRQRGQHTFDIWVGTLWHYDDALMRMVEAARLHTRTDGREGICYRVSIQVTGGPKTEPAFFPLWDAVYPAKELRKRYAEIRDPSLWAANYQANPIADELRVIKALRFYDPEDENHVEFMRGAEIHISLDPAATNREKSDKASLAVMAHGELVEWTGEGEFKHRFSESRIRIVDVVQFHASQHEGAAALAEYAKRIDIDHAHVEVAAGFHASKEELENRYGIMDVIPHSPGNKSKEIRLKNIAPMVDHSLAQFGLTGAVVEFPGKLNERGKVVADTDRWGWLYQQFLDFGVCSDDHALDAIVQVCKYLAPVVGVGQGRVSRAVRDNLFGKHAESQRMKPVLDRIFRREPANDGAEVEDYNFQCSMN